MTSNSYSSHIRGVFRVLNLFWYLLLTPLFIIYLLMHASGLKQYLLTGYQYALNSISMLICHKTTDVASSTNPMVNGKQALDRIAGSGLFPLTVCLGLLYTPFYMYTMVWWDTHDFLQWNAPLMLLFALVCCDDTHYDSHFWLTRRNQSVWYRRLISGRFKQYTQMIWFPLTQHLPHLHIHHKFNMSNEQDVDYVGCYQRDGLKDFLAFLSIYEWNYTWGSLRYFYTLSTSQSLLRTYVKDFVLNYGLLALAAYCGWQKFLFQYACHCLCYFFIAWVTFYVEHPFHHEIDSSYEHHWNTLTIVNSTIGLCTESHTAHHFWPARSSDDNAAWANDPVKFAISQLKNQHFAITCSGTFQELLYMPYLMITKQYSRLAQMLHFKDSDQLKAAGMEPDLIDAYQLFQEKCDGAEIKRRLQPH